VTRFERVGESWALEVEAPASLARFLAVKGSVAVDGVSLTVAGLGGTVFDVMIIPFTWANTALSSLKVHDRVNLECDMIGKYVARAVALAEEEGRLKAAPTTSA
jgi:riboflavin synthase